MLIMFWDGIGNGTFVKLRRKTSGEVIVIFGTS